jgi:hypothetical protein
MKSEFVRFFVFSWSWMFKNVFIEGRVPPAEFQLWNPDAI